MFVIFLIAPYALYKRTAWIGCAAEVKKWGESLLLGIFFFFNLVHIFLKKLPRYLLKFCMKSHTVNPYEPQPTKLQETFAAFD